jgi:very-short-patch-repair endonuclease
MNLQAFYNTNKQKLIYDLKDIPASILNFRKANRKLTATERMVSSFLQDCARYNIIKGCGTQQIIKIGKIGNYIIVDFYIKEPNIIIEVDGPEHGSLRDAKRDKALLKLFGIKVLRVTNKNVEEDNKGAREFLLSGILAEKGLTPTQVTSEIKKYWSSKDSEKNTL